jgi:hypothetical protein
MLSSHQRHRRAFLILVGLLVLVGATTQIATAQPAVPFHARLVTINQQPAPCGETHVCIALNGSGVTTHLGKVSEVGQVEIDVASQPVPGQPCTTNVRTMLLTAANGDQLSLLITGVNCETGATTGITGISHDTWVVTGGTGRFSGATGSGTETVQINLPASTAWTTMSGTLSLSH